MGDTPEATPPVLLMLLIRLSYLAIARMVQPILILEPALGGGCTRLVQLSNQSKKNCGCLKHCHSGFRVPR